MFEAGLAISLVIIAFLLLLSAFFSGSETGLTAITRARIYRLEQDGNKRAKMVHTLRNRKEDLIGTILLGNNLVNIAASALATSAAIKLWGENGVFYVTLIMTSLVLVFAEVMPKTYAINNPERVALSIAPIFMVLVKIFAPITALIQIIINALLRIFGVDLKPGTTLISATDMLRGAIELQHREGDIVKLDRDMLGGILDLAEIDVEEVMVHRKNMTAIDINLPPSEIIQFAVVSGHSRIPLWEEDSDNIIGILHIRDLMRAIHEYGASGVTHNIIRFLLSEPWFIPETTSLRDQLLAFRRQRQHFALVVDEYGALLGLVTLEDILEEIVGEIDDEHDQADNTEIVADATGGYSVEGTVTIRDLNRYLDWNLPD
ncbi:MAG: HlyC/CorC family transporter, partial [Rickettsiales bacterium]